MNSDQQESEEVCPEAVVSPVNEAVKKVTEKLGMISVMKPKQVWPVVLN